MELYDVMTTTFSGRDFTDEPLPDETLFRILDRARFAPSGGNRQGWKVIVVRDRKTREGLAAATEPAAKRYAAQVQVGESPWNTIDRTRVDAATIERTPPPARLIEPVLKAAVVLVIGVDLKVVASMDAELDRVGVISGASISARESAVQALLGLPSHVALAAVMPLGRPVKRLTRLKRKPVEEFAMLERWNGSPLRGSA